MKNLISRISISLAMIFALSLAIVALAPRAEAGEVRCTITAIDIKSGLVTAKDKTTGETCQFKVKDRKLLKTWKIGQVVAVDFRTGRVKTITPDGAKPRSASSRGWKLSWACTEDMKDCSCEAGSDCDSICVDTPTGCKDGVCNCTGPGKVPPPRN